MKCITYGCLLLLSMSFSWPDQTYEALSKHKNVLASPYMKIETIPAPEGNWTYLPEGDGEMKIIVTTSRAKRIKVWRVPTGTQQWEFRKLICDKSGDRENWTCSWKYDEHDVIHDHFVVEVFGKDWDISQSINVTRRHADDHSQ